MTVQREHGCWGENVAAELLRQKGMTIVSRNWRYKRAEIDIVAKIGEVLVFVEVRARDSVSWGKPEETVRKRKRRLLIDAAMAYMRMAGHEWEIRFDIVSIIGKPEEMREVHHYEDAFFPGIDYKG